MFNAYLEREHPELRDDAEELGIGLETLESLFALSPTTAVNSLRELIKSRTPVNQEVRVDRVEEFQTRYKDTISAALEVREQIENAVAAFREETDTRIIIDWNAPRGKPFVRLGRAPRGSKMVPKRDLSRLYKYLKARGIATQIRVAPSEQSSYSYGELLADGRIKADGKIFPDLSSWVNNHVYKQAVERGERAVSIGSPYKGAKVQNARGDWQTIDRAWSQMLQSEKETPKSGKANRN